jgi:hypothetical protein
VKGTREVCHNHNAAHELQTQLATLQLSAPASSSTQARAYHSDRVLSSPNWTGAPGSARHQSKPKSPLPVHIGNACVQNDAPMRRAKRRSRSQTVKRPYSVVATYMIPAANKPANETRFQILICHVDAAFGGRVEMLRE